ncbi:hypothetical protein JIX56_10305 [Streptomyces sp. CA-210063]|uniref:hypothetical protein n=1 Tax=Streptomyces sp. CA-210063 TaxID=2801029 RepID=UPI00214AE74A|nr:hypothetical protein [Streptomyces sp. CA-210063]UUU30255.1 hypothetical protein JIX56_10305 [Streptomyces sp. CA-210063]
MEATAAPAGAHRERVLVASGDMTDESSVRTMVADKTGRIVTVASDAGVLPRRCTQATDRVLDLNHG